MILQRIIVSPCSPKAYRYAFTTGINLPVEQAGKKRHNVISSVMWCNIQSVEKYFFVMKLWACFSFVFKQQCLNKTKMLNAVF